MSAITKFTRRSLAKNRVRTGVTIAGVALAAALLTGVLTCVTSLNAFLYENEVAENGLWTASAWIDDDATIQDARESVYVTDLVVMRDVGFAQLDEQAQQYAVEYLPVVSAQGDISRICGITADEGRLPESSDEILLNASWKGTTHLSDEPLKVGSTITLDMGQRMVISSDANEDPSDLANTHTGADGFPEDGEVDTLHAGDLLDSGWAYVDAESDGGAFAEELVNREKHTYTVVGFYNSNNIATTTALGGAAITAEGSGERASESAGAGYANVSKAGTKIFLVTTGFSTQEELDETMSDVLGVEHVSLHHAVLNYSGVTDDRAVWDTFTRFAIILAAVIIVACVSLIYNAFAISVAERTRQFGLLSSIGASGRQIRSAIVFEALVIAAIGVPLGLLAGIGGTALVLHLIGPSIVTLYGAAEDVAFGVCVDPAAIAFAAALTLATVLISVWVPARRAASVSAVDAIRRAQDVRPAKTHAIRRKEHASPAATMTASKASSGTLESHGAPADASDTSSTSFAAPDSARADSTDSISSRLWKPRGISVERAFGVPGYIARANRKRGRSKGRAASVSLALAIVLLMTAGSLSTTLGSLTDAVSAGEANSDITFSAHSSETVSKSEDVTGQIEGYESLYRTLLGVEDAQPCGRSYNTSATVVIPANMAGTGLSTNEVSSNTSASHALLSDGSVVSMCNFVFLPDEEFRTYAQQAGVDPSQFFGEDNCAIAIKGGYGNNGSTYTYRENLRDTGTAHRVSNATSNGSAIGYLSFSTRYVSPEDSASGQDALAVSCEGDILDESYNVVETIPFEELDITTEPIEVVALTDKLPEQSTLASELPTFVMPLSMAQNVLGNVEGEHDARDADDAEGVAEDKLAKGVVGDNADADAASDDAADTASDSSAHAARDNAQSSFFNSYLSMTALFDAEDHARVADDLRQAAEDAGAHSFTDSYLGGITFSVSDSVAAQEQNDMLIAIVNLFTMLFTGILALIAMANVFNTVTNGLILRRREFAVMRSVGMGNSAFYRMIVCECVGYGIRGLVPGVIISTLVSYLLYDAMTQSVQGLTFALPWTHIGIAVALVVIIMGTSVAYGLRRCRTDSIVDALRDDVA